MNTLTDPERLEIKQAIAFYESRGWDWLSLVAFLADKALSKQTNENQTRP